MSYNYFNKYLSNKEDVIEIIYSIKLFFYLKFLFYFLLFLAPFFFMVPIMKLGLKGIVLFFVIIIFASFRILIIYFRQFFNCLILTSEKMYRSYQDWLFDREVKEFSINNIEKVSFSYENWFLKLFQVGNLKILLKNGIELELESIKRPKRLTKSIL